MVKMINLSAVGAFYVKMTLAFFTAYKLINEASAVSFDRAVNKSVFNQLCHESVCRALTYFVFAHVVYYFFNRKSFIAVGLQKVNQCFSLMCVIYFQITTSN